MKTWAHSNRLAVVLLGALLVACIVAYERERARHSYVVSLINLLTDPQRYIDDRVVVKGYLEDYHGLTLFLTKEHADAGDHLSAVYVSDPTYEGVLTQSSCVGSLVPLVEDQFIMALGIVKVGEPPYTLDPDEFVSVFINPSRCGGQGVVVRNAEFSVSTLDAWT